MTAPDYTPRLPPSPDDQQAAGGMAHLSVDTGVTRVLFVTPEMSDFTQVGGLGEVSAALPRALRLGADVRVLIPGYPEVLASGLPVEVIGHVPAFCSIPASDVGLLHTADGLPVYVLLCPALYERAETPYVGRDGRDWADSHIRFARLSHAAAEFARGVADPFWRPELLHLNDWPTALAPAYLAWSGVRTPTVLTIHNLAYQGLFEAGRGGERGVRSNAFDVNGVEFHGRLSFLNCSLFFGREIDEVDPEEGGDDGDLYRPDRATATRSAR